MNKLYSYIISAALLVFLMPSCANDSASLDSSASGEVLSGSYARMLALGDRLYLLSTSKLNTLDISSDSNPTPIASTNVTESIESLFFNQEHLFVGSEEGMFIYSLNDSGVPELESVTPYETWQEVLPCDPIAANNTHAYSTLSTTIAGGGPCQRWTQINELRVYDISDVSEPVNINTMQMEEPKGIGIDGELLFICENTNGIRIFDISDPSNLVSVYTDTGFSARDVIAANGLLLVMGQNEIHQYDYSDITNIRKLSLYEIKD